MHQIWINVTIFHQPSRYFIHLHSKKKRGEGPHSRTRKNKSDVICFDLIQSNRSTSQTPVNKTTHVETFNSPQPNGRSKFVGVCQISSWPKIFLESLPQIQKWIWKSDVLISGKLEANIALQLLLPRNELIEQNLGETLSTTWKHQIWYSPKLTTGTLEPEHVSPWRRKINDWWIITNHLYVPIYMLFFWVHDSWFIDSHRLLISCHSLTFSTSGFIQSFTCFGNPKVLEKTESWRNSFPKGQGNQKLAKSGEKNWICLLFFKSNATSSNF